MKKAMLYIPIVLSLLLLGAHFLRYGNTIVVIGVLALTALLFVPRWWVARLMQFVLAAGALEWLRTIIMLVHMRMAMGEPYLRMAAILGVVMAVTAVAAVLFQARELKAYYRLDKSS
jgi:presenilin-like A22 family membrane protease